MAKAKKPRFSIDGEPLYPHIKLTRERFPRALATRLIADDDAEYFGAFLNRSNARLLLDFLTRTFRLRGCEFDLDGSFNVPCTQYYRRRCLAPCVESLCTEEEYTEAVGFVCVFLANERQRFTHLLTSKIDAAADQLDFGRAAALRDIFTAVEAYWADTRRSVWLDGTVDTIEARDGNDGIDIFLISQKGRRVLGERTFTLPNVSIVDADRAISDVILQFYLFHVPREIRVSHDFAERRGTEELLAQRFGRDVRISMISTEKRRVMADMAVYRSSAELDVKRANPTASPSAITRELKAVLKLKRTPKLITAVDASHISGTGQVVASIAWENGRTIADRAKYVYAEGEGDAASIGTFVEDQLLQDAPGHSHLILIDGGWAQLKAALSNDTGRNVAIISAVKPPGRHDDISHFLLADGTRIDFDPASAAMLLLHRLRDEAHEYANAIHRDTRDFAAFYTTAGILPSLNERERRMLVAHFGSNARLAKATRDELEKVIGTAKADAAIRDLMRYNAGEAEPVRPLIVPLRYQAENGSADDLRPIELAAKKGVRAR
ncbi:excinuclease ABC subunit UvrC [soil metagenome]